MTKSFSQHIWSFMHNRKFYFPALWQYEMSFFSLYRFMMMQTFFVSQTFHVLMFWLQLLLTNLHIFLKIDVLATKTEYHQLTKMVLQMVSITGQRCCATDILCIYRSLSIIRQNVAVPVESAGILENWTKLY